MTPIPITSLVCLSAKSLVIKSPDAREVTLCFGVHRPLDLRRKAVLSQSHRKCRLQAADARAIL